MSDTPDSPAQALPDRLAINPKSPFYDATLLERGVGILFKGAERTDVEEYCVSEGWIRVALGKKTDRFGQPLTIKLQGEVVAFLREGPEVGQNDQP